MDSGFGAFEDFGEPGVPPIIQGAYNYQPKHLRVLWHTGLGEMIKYNPPMETLNFDLYPIIKPSIVKTKTIASTVVTRFENYIEDLEITEKWLEKDLSVDAGLFFALLRWYQNPPATGQYIYWYPKDKTNIAFKIEILDIIAGDARVSNVNPIHSNWLKPDYRYLQKEVAFVFRILPLEEVPEAIVLLDQL
jgi:hypothetical protein